MITRPSLSFALLHLSGTLAIGAAGALETPSAGPQSRQAEERPVSWVNPSLPEGPGLVHHVLASSALGHDVGYVVWTPPDYDASKTYPVVYFLHGRGGHESADAAGFSGWVARGMREGLIPPVIVVFPNGGRSGYSGSVETMIVEELIPLIDRTYPTRGSPETRAVAGFSMGGAGAVRLAVLHPDLFAAAASMGGGERKEVVDAAARTSARLKERDVGFLFINGDRDRPDAFAALSSVLSHAGVENRVIIHPDLDHRLGRYYELSYEALMSFLGRHLRP